MASRDLHNNVKATPALNPQAISANGAVNGAIIDLAGYESAEFMIQSATLTDGTYTPSITAGDVSDLSDGAAVGTTDLIGTIADATFAATADNSVKKLGYKGGKRYIRLTVTAAGVTSGGTLAAIAALGHPKSAPVA